MKFGLLALFETPEGRSEAEVVRDQIELMVAADALGFDSVWPAEHHFSEYGHCATPAVTLAAVAARTQRVRLGTGVVVLPLNHPVRVAEDYAFLDLLSGGRIDLGVGRGYQPAEFRGYGVDQSLSREMMLEAIEVIRKAWTEERFSHHGRFYSFDDLSVRPKPLQTPHPPIWMASLSGDSFEVCGRNGIHLLCAPVFGFDLPAGSASIQRYRGALSQAGHDPAAFNVAALTITYVADTTAQAHAEIRDAVLWYYRTLARHIAARPGATPAAGYEYYGQARTFLETVDWDTVLERGAVICGSPQEVVDRIAEVRARCGFDHFLAWTRVGGLAKSKVMRSMELMAERVMPAFR